MSTYYYFYCKPANLIGGFFSKQTWGWGNADIIDSFKFIMYCTDKYGPDSISIVSEDCLETLSAANVNNPTDQKEREDIQRFLEETKDIFPYSRDWDR